MGGGVGYSLQTSASSGASGSGFDSSGFNINFGNQNQPGNQQTMLMFAALALVAVLLLRRR